ncbi:MAG TPA: S41 family peptidase [Paludibacteraceae bacterium]|nr:S41 family peptidase [Paludibacteraceae bacterium]HOV84018.1 S41 family peptidase [Paludibacteraceae bacterium]
MKKTSLLSFLLLLIPFIIFAQNQTSNRTFRISKNLNIYNSIFRELDMFYVDTLNYDKIVRTSIDKMLGNLDPYTVYIPEEETEDLTFMTTGEYAGIGALIMKKGDDIVVSEVYEGMPAQRNDIRAGDIILEVDGQKTTGMSVDKVSALLRGIPNTQIKIKIKRYGEKKIIEKKFIREKIQIKPIVYAGQVAEKIGYIQLGEFTDGVAFELKSSLNELVKNYHITSLVLDIRSNGGGLVDEAVKILGYFLPKGTEVVTTRGKNKELDRIYKTPTEPIYPDMKLAILVNRSSASASEILAGAIQDLDRGVIIGERTFGKGLVQNIRAINFGGHLKVTTAKYYIPSGRCIQAIDYNHRNEDGSVGYVPDSLTSEFSTRNGRKVRDGGGIVPDILTDSSQKLNIAHYIYAQNLYFDFATQYAYQHPSIAPPDSFELSEKDFNDFVNFLKERKFTYTSQTEKYYNQLYQIAEIEGLDSIAQPEFEALKKKLTPDIDKNIQANKNDIVDFLSLEIIKRYYFQKGQIQYSLRNDNDLQSALEVLQSEDKYKKILSII